MRKPTAERRQGVLYRAYVWARGGDIFTLAGEFLQSDDFMKQAKFIAEAANMTVAGWGKARLSLEADRIRFEDVEVAPLLRSLLTEYLEERGIPYAIASRHCCRLNYGVRETVFCRWLSEHGRWL